MENTLRLATPEDVEALLQLIAVSVRGLNTEDYTPVQVESILKYVYEVDMQLIHDGTYFVVQASAEDGAAMIGCGGWSKRDSENNLLDPAVDAARIRAFFVHSNWARQGIGSLLMQACEDAALAAGFHTLTLMATLTGEKLYTRLGFKLHETRELLLPDGNLIKVRQMTKDLSA